MNARESYTKGVRDGLVTYAWWKDGVEYVGTCGTTLRQALENVENLHSFDPPPEPTSAIQELMERCRHSVLIAQEPDCICVSFHARNGPGLYDARADTVDDCLAEALKLLNGLGESGDG